MIERLTTARRLLAAIGIALAAAACAPGASRPAAPLAGASDAVVATIPIGAFGTGIAITPDGSRAYVAANAKVFAIDTASNRLVATIDTDDTPYTIERGRGRCASGCLRAEAPWVFAAGARSPRESLTCPLSHMRGRIVRHLRPQARHFRRRIKRWPARR